MTLFFFSQFVVFYRAQFQVHLFCARFPGHSSKGRPKQPNRSKQEDRMAVMALGFGDLAHFKRVKGLVNPKDWIKHVELEVNSF